MDDFTPADQPVNFGDPAVNEVALSVQFATPAIDLEVLGDVAGRVKTDFPIREQHPPLMPMVEEFGTIPQGPQIVFQTQPDLPRTWFVSADSTRVLQIQADRLVYNWRRTDSAPKYPRYNALRTEFVTKAEPVLAAVADAGGSTNIIEISYVNELRIDETEPRVAHPRLGEFVRSLHPMKGDFLDEPEDMRLQARWQIPGTDGPAGRLYTAMEPVYRRDEVPVYLLTLTARLVSVGADIASTLELLDVAHNWIVRGFKDLTTKAMHDTWKLETESSR